MSEREPERPGELTKRSWIGVLKRTFKEYNRDNLSDWAAGLTYYSILSIFPGLVVLVAALGLLGRSTRDKLIANITEIVPAGSLRNTINGAIHNLTGAPRAAGITAIISLLVALWSASGYVAAFVRAANAIYDVPEGRPFWKLLPLRLGVTVVVGILVALIGFSVLLTGKVGDLVGKLAGIGPTAVTVFSYAKWPIMILILVLVLSILYWASPNARPSGFRWITPGTIVAVVLWVLASGGFALYLGTVATYNKTYGALGGVIAFLVWLWLSNNIILLGGEFDAEMERGRAIQGGHPADEEPYMELRDTRTVPEDEKTGEKDSKTGEKDGATAERA